MAIRPNRKPMKFASGAKDRQQRNAIEAAIADAMKGASGPVMSDLDQQLLNQMRDKFSSQILGEAGKTLSDADLRMSREIVDPLFASLKGEIGRIKKAPLKPKPRPDVGAIERGNRAARRTAQDLASMEEGGEVPNKYKGFSKLPEEVQEKISPDLAEKYEFGGKVKGKKNKGNVCRGGGAALRGTKFSGTK